MSEASRFFGADGGGNAVPADLRSEQSGSTRAQLPVEGDGRVRRAGSGGQVRPVVVLVAGTRPEAIKLAPVARALNASGWAAPLLVATGQHGDVVREVFSLFDLEPSKEVPPVGCRESLGELSSRLLREIDAVLAGAAPDLVVVQGDTATTLAGALAGYFRGIPVAHVEAGLRTGDLAAPFPEEGNRRVVGQIATLHLAPTARAGANLVAAGIPPERIVVTGNTVIDALMAARDAACPYDDETLESLDRSGRRLVVVTAHRRESWGEPIRRIGRAVGRLSWLHPDCNFVVAAHMNPAVRGVLEQQLGGRVNVYLSGPVSYGAFARLLGRASLVVTDSGGVQEEASAVGVPVVVTRDVTERTESLEAGVAALVGREEEGIVAATSRLLDDHHAYAAMARVVYPYGDGTAGERTAQALSWLLGLTTRPDDYVAPCDSIRQVPA